MAIAIALLGFNDLRRSVTPTSTWEGKKIHDFCPRDIESYHHAASRSVKLWSLNANLLFEEPHQLTKFP